MDKQGILVETGTNEMELLTILLDDQPFGMNVSKVQSIQQYEADKITKLPNAQPEIEGMFLYRDKTIPLLDLAKILGIKSHSNLDNEIIIVTEFNNFINGFKVHGVKRIYRISWQKFVPLDSILKNNSFFTGSVDIDDLEVLVLDLEYILSNFFPELIIESIEQEMLQLKETISREQLEIIFAEDSLTIQKTVMEILKKAGFSKITSFINGEEALHYIKNRFAKDSGQKIKNVVLISDIEMPKMDGLTLCRHIKQNSHYKDIFTIMFSSLINKQMIEKCKKVKADNYVTKPEVNNLIKILDKQCDIKN